jgi:pSer/pThr/pTyr-binding forkhead associated (FHA) protein
MAKLVILNQGMTGRTFDLNIERSTVGRVEDNTLQIADASVSSHHAEIILRGTDILIRDLNSTNGTFINDEQITEKVLRPGQKLRFGQVELKIEDGTTTTAPAPAPAPFGGKAPGPAPAPAKKPAENTLVIPRGVSLNELEHGGARPAGFDTKTAFAKKKNKSNKYFLIGGIIVGVIIVGLIIYLLTQTGGPR